MSLLIDTIGNMRSIAPPFLIAPRPGVRIRTRLRVDAADERVLRAVGEYLGRLAGIDLATRCRLGCGSDRRADRKRALTAASSSRWAGALTRTSNDQWKRGWRNLHEARANLRRAIRVIDRRLAAPVGGRRGRVRGYASGAEHWQKQRRRQVLATRLARVEARIQQGRVSVVRGGRRLLRNRQHLEDTALTEAAWRVRWDAERWFICADGEADKAWGNETIRVHPDAGWLELKLPAVLVGLANRPHGRYRLSCPVRFSHRGDEWAAHAASCAVQYDISLDSNKGRWYLHASWTRPPVQPMTVQAAVAGGVVAVDLNAGHLACFAVDRHGNPTGPPITIRLELDGLPASTRDGRLREAVTLLLDHAGAAGCGGIAVEALDFADARAAGREIMGRGRRGRRFRGTVAGIPTRRFRDRLVQMAANRGLAVVAVDAAWTSVWGGRYWQTPLQARYPSRKLTRHHAASVVVGRRALGLGARRRPGMLDADRRISVASNCRPGRFTAPARGGHDPPATRPGGSIVLRKTGSGDRDRRGAQGTQDRSASPVSVDRH
jgi:hypothetical protein